VLLALLALLVLQVLTADTRTLPEARLLPNGFSDCPASAAAAAAPAPPGCVGGDTCEKWRVSEQVSE
jgi:hypothetical protein